MDVEHCVCCGDVVCRPAGFVENGSGGAIHRVRRSDQRTLLQ
jgi:hypothetical protein